MTFALHAHRVRDKIATSAFLRLVIGNVVSEFGSNLSIIVIPTFAILFLKATAEQVTWLYILEWLPVAFLALPSGGLTDRFDRLRLAAIADLAAAVVAFGGAYLIFTKELNLELLYAIVLFASACGAMYQIATQALLPRLIGRQDLVRRNSQLYFGSIVARVAGQGLAARLLAFNDGALVLFCDGISFVIRALLLVSMFRLTEREPRDAGLDPKSRSVLSTYAYLKTRTDLVRIFGSQASLNIGGTIIQSFFLVFAYRELHLAAYHIALMLVVGSLASVVPTFFASRLVERVGALKLALLSVALSACALWLIPIAQYTTPVSTLFLYQAIFSCCSSAFHISTLSYRQQSTSAVYLGRTTSADVAANALAVLLGFGLAAALAGKISVEAGILSGCLIASTSVFWLLGIGSGRADPVGTTNP